MSTVTSHFQSPLCKSHQGQKEKKKALEKSEVATEAFMLVLRPVDMSCYVVLQARDSS